MGAKRNKDKCLSNGSVIYWSCRFKQDGRWRVPVRCGRCRKERTVTASRAYSKGFSGLCLYCAMLKFAKIADETLPNGTVIYWSQRFKHKSRSYVPIRCPSCEEERTISANNTFKKDFTGLCSHCYPRVLAAKRLKTEDAILPNGSIVYWSRRLKHKGYWRVPICCGKCGEEHIVHAGNIHKITGLCARCNRAARRKHTYTGVETLPNGSVIYWDDEIHRDDCRYVLVRCGGSICGGSTRYVSMSTIQAGNFTGLCLKCAHPPGPQSRRWKGRKITSDGYVLAWLLPDHPFRCMADASGYVREHRLIVAQHLGRPLTSDEIVHHKNLDKQDNHLDNLELLTRAESHPGYHFAETTPRNSGLIAFLKNLFR